MEDTARVLSRYLDGIMIRTFAQEEVEALANVGSIPVINGLTDYCHPCQVLADLMTIREHKGSLEGLKLCYIGDGNNMANSLIAGCIKVGMKVSSACPDAYQPDAELMKWASENGEFCCTSDIAEAVKDAGTVIWNGPMGVSEWKNFASGTESVAKAVAESGAISIIGGGDSAAAVQKLGYADKMTHISTGGGASLEFLEGKVLPGIAALNEK